LEIEGRKEMEIDNIFGKGPGIFDYKSYDISAWVLLFSNLFVVVMAAAENWNFVVVMLVYWCQSVTIGIFNVIRIATFSAPAAIRFPPDDNINLNLNLPRISNIFLAAFFALHYGFFHFGYLSFLRFWAKGVDLKLVILPTAIFFLNHLFSFLYNYKKDRQRQDPKDIARIMFFPYGRIIPMHLTIILAGFLFPFALALKWDLAATLVLVFFLLLKTGADIKMHLVEHAWDTALAPTQV